MREKIETKLSVFGFGGLQNLVTLFNILERENISINDVRQFIAFALKRREENEIGFQKMIAKRDKEMRKLAGNCPKCKTPLRIRTIHSPKGKANVYGYRSHYFCGNEECDYEKYSKEPVKILVKKMVRR